MTMLSISPSRKGPNADMRALLMDWCAPKGYHTPLSLATQRGDTARVVEILREGADPNAGMAVGPYGLLGCGSQ